MRFDPERHHRRSIRLKRHDYARAGAYFVTICAKDRECLFGQIEGETVILSEDGRLVDECWHLLPRHFPNVELDAFVLMPNHVHGIIWITDMGMDRGTACRAPTVERFGHPVSHSLPTIIRSFKSAVSQRINERRTIPGVLVWQRNYYEHIIRSDEELNRIREYIANNPAQWAMDPENPAMTADTVRSAKKV
jgi:REP element-mobilizing transposase RayT